MKKKNLVAIISGLVIIVLLLAGYFILENMPDDTKTPEKIDDNSIEVLVPGLSRENISEVTVYRRGELINSVFKEKVTGEFLIEGRETNLYNEQFTSFFSSLIYMNVIEEVKDPLEDSEYGLSESAYTINITKTDGEKITVYVGDLLVTGGAYYCKISGDDRVFIVSNGIETALLDKTSFISTLLANPVDSSMYYFMENVTLYKDMQKFVSISLVPEKDREAGNAFGIYKMDFPAEYVPSDTNYDTVLRSLISPRADTIVTLDITKENLEKYGFNAPSFELEYSIQGIKRNIYFGKKTADGLIYVLSYDYGFIGLVSIAQHFPYLEWELIDYINTTLFGMNIDKVSKIRVSSKGGGSDTYLLDGEGQALIVTNERTRTTVDTYNFRQFYRTLLMTNMEGYAESTSTDDWVLTFGLETRSGKIYEFKFYQISTRKCYYTVNGKGEFYVNISEVEKIISDAAKLLSGEPIDADAKT